MNKDAILCLGFTLLMNFSLFGQGTNKAQFTRLENTYAKELDFPYGTVWSALMDSRGFMWFGGSNGLIRYDGVEYKIYHTDETDSTALSKPYIHYLFEDSRGYIWMSTGISAAEPRGFHVFNPKTEQFRNININVIHTDRKSTRLNSSH